MCSFKKNLILLLISLLLCLLATFSNWINYSDTRLVPSAVRSDEEERVVENGSLQASSPTARQGNSASARSLRGGPHADR